MKKRRLKIKKGQRYLVDSYCSVRHIAEVTRPDMPDGFYGILVDVNDIKRLNEAGVPAESISDEFFVFEYHIVKRVYATNRKISKKGRSCKVYRRKK